MAAAATIVASGAVDGLFVRVSFHVSFRRYCRDAVRLALAGVCAALDIRQPRDRRSVIIVTIIHAIKLTVIVSTRQSFSRSQCGRAF